MRRYESARRAEQAEQTRADIADAARRLFVERGWATTTIRAVAQEAGVSVPTVYATYGDKPGLVRALVESADLAADGAQQLADLEASTLDPQRQLAAMAAYDRRLFERAGDLITLIRDAARTEPDLATAYLDGRRLGDQTRVRVFSAWPSGVLRAALDVPTAVDIYAAICNLDVYNTLHLERGWSADRIEWWWSAALVRELLA
ncbi:TetR/AcrR family transcriptional regulator [Flindersiella endophytica]